MNLHVSSTHADRQEGKIVLLYQRLYNIMLTSWRWADGARNI